MRVCRVASRWFRWSGRSQKHARQHKGEQDCGDNDDDPDQKERDGLPPSAPRALVNDGPVLPAHRDHRTPTYTGYANEPGGGVAVVSGFQPWTRSGYPRKNLTTAPTQAARRTAVVLQRLWSLQGDAVSVRSDEPERRDRDQETPNQRERASDRGKRRPESVVTGRGSLRGWRLGGCGLTLPVLGPLRPVPPSPAVALRILVPAGWRVLGPLRPVPPSQARGLVRDPRTSQVREAGLTSDLARSSIAIPIPFVTFPQTAALFKGFTAIPDLSYCVLAVPDTAFLTVSAGLVWVRERISNPGVTRR